MKSAAVKSCAVLVPVLGLAVASAPTTASAAVVDVEAGQSIQAAVDGAAPGDTIRVKPGDYTEMEADAVAAVRITKPLKLVALGAPGKVRILWNGLDAQRDGILVEPDSEDANVDGVEITGFTVEGFPHNGIFLRHVSNFNIESNQSINNLENGIWPTLSANGQVKKNVSYGSQDSALWVEASENVRVIDNELHHSPTGLEITISKEITVERNDIHNNTVGVGLYHPAAAGLDSPWPYTELGNWHIADNDVHNNNEENTAEGGETAELPPGIGILLLGVDNVDLQKNRIETNDFVGIAMVDWCLAVAGSGFDCSADTPDLQDTALDNNQVIGNKLADNHTGTPPPGPFATLASDILYVDGSIAGLPPGTNNCSSANKLIKTPLDPDPLTIALPLPLPECN
jgi:parallel beta-helix repeat protein